MIVKKENRRDHSYRSRIRTGRLISFGVRVKETDLLVHAGHDLERATRDLVITYRNHIESYIKRNPEFVSTLVPWEGEDPAPPVVMKMIEAGRNAGVGPMAAVAGAIAESVGIALLGDPRGTGEVVVENGGDIFIKVLEPITVGIYAGSSPLSLKVGLKIRPCEGYTSVCTSSGTVGHSLSFGKADAVCVVSSSCSLADAVATATGNRIKSKKDISRGIEFAKEIPGVAGVVVILGGELGVWGDVELVSIGSKKNLN